MQTQGQLATNEGATDVVLVDVREPGEYAAGHRPGAINLPLSEIQAGELGELRRDQVIQLYCRSGSRAEVARAIMIRAGYTDVHVVPGVDGR